MLNDVKLDEKAKKLKKTVDGEEAYLEYEMKDKNIIDFVSTYVPKNSRNEGVAGEIAEAAFDYAERNSFLVIPTCKYVKAYLQKHEELKKMVVEQ
jgi:uncharacterized protein